MISVFMAVVLPLALLMGCGGQQERPGSIEGTVTDTDSRPVVAMRVCIISGTTGFPEIAAETNEEGYYQIGSVPSGAFEVAVHDRQGKRIGLESVVVRSGDISTLNFVIPIEEKPEGTLTVAELLENPVYDTEVEIYGKVSLLGELFCPCFELTSGGQIVQVWYGLMVENGGTERPAVSVEGINNGDRVIVTGELKGEGGIHYSKGDFWANAIVVRR